MRDKYNSQLNELYKDIKEMGELCISAIEGATKAIVAPPVRSNDFESLCNSIKNLEEEIDHKERTIEGLCMRLMLHQQPVATDLRTVTSAHKIISDLERIGDQALDIVDLSKYIRKSSQKNKIQLNSLFAEVQNMVKLTLKSVTEKELNTAYKVIELDDNVDMRFIKVKEELIHEIKTGTDGELFLDILMVAKYLERIGDHAVNIANWVVYNITGSH